MNPEIWRYIFDAIEDPAFLHDMHFRVLLANRAYCRVAGVTEAQALGKPYWEVFPPGSGPVPGSKEAMLGKGDASSREEVSVGAKLFLSKGCSIRDDQASTSTLCTYSATSPHKGRSRRLWRKARNAFAVPLKRRVMPSSPSTGKAAQSPHGAVWPRRCSATARRRPSGRVLHDFLPPPRFRAGATNGLAHFATTGEGATVDQTLDLAALHKNATEFPIELSLFSAQFHVKWHATGIAL